MGWKVTSRLLTSDYIVLLLLQSEKLLVQIIVLPDYSSIFHPVRLHKSIDVPALFLSFPRRQFGIAQTVGRVDQVTKTQEEDVSGLRITCAEAAEELGVLLEKFLH